MIYAQDFTLSGNQPALALKNASFYGVLCLDNCVFEGDVNLDNITAFAHISLINTRFNGMFSMQNALLLGGFWVENTHFAWPPLLTNTIIHGRLHGLDNHMQLLHFGKFF